MRISPEGEETIRNNTFTWIVVIAIVTTTALVCHWPSWLIVLLEAAMIWRIIFVIRFFRDPVRPLVQDKDLVYSPADGRIVVSEEIDEPEYGGRCIQISVYMTFYDVHVNWYPVGGKVIYKEYYDGDFLLAWRPKSSERNEHSSIIIETDEGRKVMYRQIAGWVARRVVAYPNVGDRVEQNHKSGFIKFGSRLDIFVPVDSEILVPLDRKVVGSQTPIARLKTSTPQKP